MYNKFDTTSPLTEQSVPDMLDSQPIMASVEIADGQNFLKLPFTILELFKKRLDNWKPATNTSIDNTYQLEQLFNQFITVNDLKNNIRNVKDLVEILSHSKMSMNNRYILLMTFIVLSPASAPFSDDKFLASLIHGYNDLRYLLNTIFPEKSLAIKFLEWAKLNSPYLKGVIESATVMQYKQPVLMQMPPQPIYIIPQKNPLPQPVRSQNMSLEQNNTAIIEAFTKRIDQADTKSLKSFKYYEIILFDKNLTVAQLKDSIQTLDDLLKIFSQHLIYQHKACYSLFNYLISVFPIPKNNGNLMARLCDDSFLKRIIHKQEDIQKITAYFGSGSNPNFSKILENRLIRCSAHCKSILQPLQLPLQPNFKHSPSFFSTNIQLSTRQENNPIDLLDSVEKSVTLKESLPGKATNDIAACSEHWESDSLNQRPLKRLRENPKTSMETSTREQVPSQNSAGIMTGFFTTKFTPKREIQNPDGGEMIYVMDQSGKMSAVDEATGLSIL